MGNWWVISPSLSSALNLFHPTSRIFFIPFITSLPRPCQAVGNLERSWMDGVNCKKSPAKMGGLGTIHPPKAPGNCGIFFPNQG